MTRPYPRRSGYGAALSPSAGEYRLYRFFGHDGALLYIGVTGRAAWRRLIEHVADKPWADEMAGWEVDPRVWYSEADVLAVEKQTIHDECPRYNTAHNGNNPHRVVVARPRREVRQPARRALRIRSGWWTRPAAWLAVWLLLAAALWWAARGVWSGWDGPRNAAVGSVVVLAGVRYAARPKRRRRRRGWW